MDFEKRLEALEKSNSELKEEAKFLKLRIGLVAAKSHINQILYEYEVDHCC